MKKMRSLVWLIGELQLPHTSCERFGSCSSSTCAITADSAGVGNVDENEKLRRVEDAVADCAKRSAARPLSEAEEPRRRASSAARRRSARMSELIGISKL